VAEAQELEADDAMGSYAEAEAQADGRALLLSGDRDMYQVVSDRVGVLELGKGGVVVELGPEQVLKRYGVAPAQVPDFIALRGDPSDGLPGAPGIGAKTAAELLRRHDTLEGVLIAAAAENDTESVQGAAMRPRVAASLRESAELLSTFKRIATLVPIDVQPPADRPTDFASGASAARELGMKRLAERLERMTSADG
jgi:DNA polymerase-1